MEEISFGLGALTVFFWKNRASVIKNRSCMSTFDMLCGTDFYGLKRNVSQKIEVFTKFTEHKVEIICVPTGKADKPAAVQTPSKIVNLTRNLHSPEFIVAI
jgi:hypothetical protein